MPHADYPTVADLETALTEAGLFSESWRLDLTGALDAARAGWERDSDWKPFLAKPDESPRRFTLWNNKTLWLRAGLIAAPSMVVVDGTERARDGYAGWELLPANAGEESEPFTAIRFGHTIHSQPSGVMVIGRWGFCEQLPNDVFRAILRRAAWEIKDDIARGWNRLNFDEQQNRIKAKESGPVRVEYATTDSAKSLDLEATFAGWFGSYANALRGRVMEMP